MAIEARLDAFDRELGACRRRCFASLGAPARADLAHAGEHHLLDARELLFVDLTELAPPGTTAHGVRKAMKERVKVFTYASGEGSTVLESGLEDHINDWLRQVDGRLWRGQKQAHSWFARSTISCGRR